MSSGPQFTVTLDGSGKVPKDIFPRMVADGPRQASSIQDRLGSKNGARVKRARQDEADISIDDRRRSTSSVVRKRARLDGGDLRHRLSGPPSMPTETSDLRQRLSNQDSGTFLRPAKTVVRPSSGSRQVRTTSDAPVRSALYTAPQSRVATSKAGGPDLRNRLNSVTPLPTAIASSVPSFAPRRAAAPAAQSTVTDVRSKPVAAPATRPVTVPRAQPAAPAQSQMRPVAAPQAQGKLRSEVVLPSGAVSQAPAPGGVRRLASVVKKTNPEPAPMAVAPVAQAAGPAGAPKTVRGLLISLGLEKYMDIFVREEVDMTALKHMEESDLKELGIPMGPRKKIVQALR
ncbi:hypothetical protein KFL_006150060 [Klebsormidium nitens]|uniref:SAM domain-containing protein n=1 Tax=Klebsormidium nitens TaxID=105231 RepID=A0A1Y1IHA9_KLENI|nr:hypothetical protein KFL_006150060 [Klebsormidium nitens]|eukprot:GAQ90224.1 hypothetical protein KFL_006150060 [Klebsormidium nitens]